MRTLEIDNRIRAVVSNFERTARGTVKGKFSFWADRLCSDDEEERILKDGTKTELLGLVKSYTRVFEAESGQSTPPSAQRSKAPALVFGTPYVRSGVPFRDMTDRGNVVHTSSFVDVALRNEGDEEAQDVVIWLSFETLNGRRLSNDAKAHWADQQDAGERSIHIPANRDPHAIDVVMKIVSESVCWVYDDDSERHLHRDGHEINEREFLVKLVTHSSNAPDVAMEVCVRHGGRGAVLEICPEAKERHAKMRLLGGLIKQHETASASPTAYVSHKQQIVSGCIERGIGLRNGISLQSDSMQTNWIGGHAEEWAKESWELLGREVPGLRGLFHMQTHAGVTAPEIMGYLDMRLSELRTILGKLK